MGKRVAVLQSNYLPWKGYFHIIQSVDVFIFYDDVQYTKNDWRNRNRIKTVNGEQWLTVPVGSGDGLNINQIVLNQHSWQQKHWRSVAQGYARAPHFAIYKPFFENLYLQREWTSLSELNQYAIRTISSQFLGLPTIFERSEAYTAEGTKLERLLNLLAAAGATEYVSGPAARAYINESEFSRRGIKLQYMNYERYPEYPQQCIPFNHYVSLIDLLFMVGADAPRFIWGEGRNGHGS